MAATDADREPIKEIPQPTAWLGGGLIIMGGLLLVRSRFKIRLPASTLRPTVNPNF